MVSCQPRDPGHRNCSCLPLFFFGWGKLSSTHLHCPSSCPSQLSVVKSLCQLGEIPRMTREVLLRVPKEAQRSGEVTIDGFEARAGMTLRILTPPFPRRLSIRSKSTNGNWPAGSRCVAACWAQPQPTSRPSELWFVGSRPTKTDPKTQNAPTQQKKA